MIDLGPMDREGILYLMTPSTGAGGVVSYAPDAGRTVYLSQMKLPIANRLVAVKESDQADAIFRTRWSDTFTFANGSRLTCEGHTYRIVNRQELGRREGLEIYAREDV
jgi:hypothetical protein